MSQQHIEDKKEAVEIDSHDNQQEHNQAGQYIKSAVYGGLDGLSTVLIITVSAVGSGATPNTIVALGIASLIGDGLSMAIADYLATKSDGEYMKQEEQREREEIQNDFQAEKAEMVTIYNDMGLEKPVAEEIVEIISTNKQAFLGVMMIEQLKLIAGEQNPITNAIVTFFSFGLFGLTALIPAIVGRSKDMKTIEPSIWATAIAVAVVFFAVLGVMKSCVSGGTWYFSVIETILVGAIASGAAYGVGVAFGA